MFVAGQDRILNCAMIKCIDPDIYSLNETHLRESEIIDVKSYTWVGFNRTRIHKDAPKASGGVGLLIKQTLLKEYTVDSRYLEFQWTL